MRISITGSRDLKISFEDISKYLPEEVSTIVSGGAAGVDRIAADYARSFDIPLVEIRPDYSGVSSRRLAPLLRNTQIVEQVDYCLIFWDGVSAGTRDTIAKARKAGRHGKVIIQGLVSTVISF